MWPRLAPTGAVHWPASPRASPRSAQPRCSARHMPARWLSGTTARAAGTAAWARWIRPRWASGSTRWSRSCWLTSMSRAEQRERIVAIAKGVATDMESNREQHMKLRRESLQLFAAPTIDASALEKLRAEQMKLGEAASRRMLAAMIEGAEGADPGTARQARRAPAAQDAAAEVTEPSPAAAPSPRIPAAPPPNRRSPVAAAPLSCLKVAPCSAC